MLRMPRPVRLRRLATPRTAAPRTAAVAVVAFCAVLAGCAPRLAPLTRDYRVATSNSASASAMPPGTAAVVHADSLALARAAAALRSAGWTLAPSIGGALTTEPRAGTNWVLYDMRLRLDVLPLADGHLRVVFDPYRRYVWRSRTHVPYLPGGLARALAAPLDRAMQAAGLEAVATGAARDLGRRRATRVGG